jgi:uncharacterized membrane protein YidH (DUF202 family)
VQRTFDVVVSVRAGRYGWDKLIIYSYPTIELAAQRLALAKERKLMCWMRDEALSDAK